jgi:HD-like signal output (HDOD) protein
MGFESLINLINTLPPLPESVQKIESLYTQDEVEVGTLVKLIESDPILTADILARVNSPLYSFSKNIVSINQAVTLFGLSSIRGFVLSSGMNRSLELDMRAYNISNDEFSNICNLQSALMFQWYMGVDIEHVKFLAPIAFLMEMGKVIIATEVNHSAYTTLFQDELKKSKEIKDVEMMFTDMTSAKMGALLFEHWYFDESFVTVMKHMDDIVNAPEDVKVYINALRVVRKAVNINNLLSDESVEEAANLVQELRLDRERFIKTANRLKESQK